jgi:hypothetical protein
MTPRRTPPRGRAARALAALALAVPVVMAVASCADDPAPMAAAAAQEADPAPAMPWDSWDDLAAMPKDALVEAVGREGRIDQAPGWERRPRDGVAGD